MYFESAQRKSGLVNVNKSAQKLLYLYLYLMPWIALSRPQAAVSSQLRVIFGCPALVP